MKNIIYFFVYYILLLPLSIISQESHQEFHFVNIKDGIPKAGVSNIIQDHYGFIWIGTSGTGLYKFDGIDYTVYKHRLRDTTSLSSSRIECTYLDSKNRLWVGTENGLNLYDRALDQFKRISLEINNVNRELILSLEEDSSNNLLIGTYGLGLFKLDMTTFSVEKVLNSTYENGSDIYINSIQHSRQGKTFLGTNFGLKEVDFVNNKLIHTRLFSKDNKSIDDNIETLFIDSKNNLWIGFQINKGVYKCTLSNDANNSIIEVKEFKLSTKKIMDIVELSDNTLIVGTENDGLFHIKENGNMIKNYVSSKVEENSILHNSIWSLFVDNNKRIWIGYFNSGVAISDKLYDKFLNIKSLPTNDNSLRVSSVMGMVEDSSKNIWIATDGGGIDIYNPKNAEITHVNSQDKSIYSGLTSDYIKTLFVDSHENIWVGSWDSGVFILKKGEKKFTNYSIENTAGALRSNTIISLSEDSNGIIWIGTFAEGLHSYDPITKKIKKHSSNGFIKNGFSEKDIRKVLVDSEDVIWLGTTNGLFKVENQKNGTLNVTVLSNKMTQEYKNSADANHILSIYEDSNNNIWIGTRGAGVCKYDKVKDEFIWYNKFTGFNEENVSAITEDGNNNLWISGNSGLTKIDLKDFSFTNYTINDGLLSNDFNFGSVLKGSDGLLYFGNFKGVDYFNPKQIKINNSPPSLYLTNFKLFNEKVIPQDKEGPLNKVISETDSISLTHKQSVFTIEYSGINYTRPEKNNYAYYLEGYEATWNYVGQKRNATYTNLDAGNYTFKLKAANNDGVWNENPLELKITVLPPWWQTNWAIFSYLLLFLLGIYMLNQLTQSRIKEKELIRNERLQQVQNDELNKKKIQFFTNISHEFRTPLTLILNPLKDIINNADLNLPQKVKNKHAIIYKNTDRLYRLINELMDLRKLELKKMNVRAEKINLIEFSENIVDYFQEEAFRKNILLSVDADMPFVTVWADTKMLEKIIFNLLSNAIKITPDGGAITVELLSTDQLHILPLIDEEKPVKTVGIIISDTGPGLKEDQVSKIFERFYQVEGQNKTYFGGTGIGLEVVQNFVKLHKGVIEVKSKINEGTTFKILLASGNDHFYENEIVLNKKALHEKKEDFLTVPTVEISEQSDESIQVQKTNTVLIVEDNVELRDYLKLELGDQYKVLLASNGKSGVKIARESFPDVIITDVIMPEMSGFEFCKTIKTHASTSHIPLLMLTAKATIENRIEGIENGADAYMVKPFDLKLLKLRLTQLIKSRQLIFDKYFSAISGAEDNVNTSSIDKEFIQKLLSYINDNISDSNLGVEELADHLNLSRSQLYRKVKALTGQTVNEFVRRIRLERSKLILEKGNSNISETCYSVGFASPSYFSKCFKAHFGVLPTEIK
ncbi:two-component regulator propeller domain-containing protein [Flavivirga abyssicola]|uniref:hybrid sensor histidine kinase/response regulator transcription factor n=1 Tax=Flavivirga abyssicola TaxID=3063533 RepID=UPI0026E01BA8|nr:two-component regulator propeller domain-containing protein [Flavivirga sp. MEBiC07777]WVK13168.1 two-component regulator propeller domain-containing protein [Flavivirga sp. MEBiC07777]